MHIFLYFIIIAGILQIAAVNINQPGNSDLNQLVEAPQNACQQGYFFNEQICSQCQWIENGFCTCSQQGKCDQITCLQGYFLVGSSCIKHPDSNCIKGGFNSNGIVNQHQQVEFVQPIIIVYNLIVQLEYVNNVRVDILFLLVKDIRIIQYQ
ncbi:unnamed protein product [Paramecium sonneborni]|uniref:Transmembrane protein n=1 Tax=Paramecium sonneborni TaxID=65129 RepID=A0A8S1QTM6_9CILI|nr:unnamed protein product [Paramecium sonneborni]